MSHLEMQINQSFDQLEKKDDIENIKNSISN